MIPLPVITHEELLSHAKDASTYARAEAYQDNVFDVNCTPNCDDDFVVTGQCKLGFCNKYLNCNCIIT